MERADLGFECMDAAWWVSMFSCVGALALGLLAAVVVRWLSGSSEMAATIGIASLIVFLGVAIWALQEIIGQRRGESAD
jgi:FtsH-binding integral membrane protein